MRDPTDFETRDSPSRLPDMASSWRAGTLAQQHVRGCSAVRKRDFRSRLGHVGQGASPKSSGSTSRLRRERQPLSASTRDTRTDGRTDGRARRRSLEDVCTRSESKAGGSEECATPESARRVGPRLSSESTGSRTPHIDWRGAGFEDGGAVQLDRVVDVGSMGWAPKTVLRRCRRTLRRPCGPSWTRTACAVLTRRGSRGSLYV